MRLIDTHAHLTDKQFRSDLTETLARAQEAGVKRIITVGYDLPSSQAAVELARQEPMIWATVGVHPHDADKVDEAVLADLRQLAGQPKVVAIGEIGLDFYRDLSPREAQREVFRKQLELAVEVGLPVSLHDRNATDEVLAILEEYSGRLAGVAHCFSGNAKQARKYLALGFYLGVDGPVTYPKNDPLRQVLASAPANRLLVETDCPYLPPQELRGKRNEPAYVALVLAALAEVLGLPAGQLAEQTTRNAEKLFGVLQN